jgi:hypothetical protein
VVRSSQTVSRAGADRGAPYRRLSGAIVCEMVIAVVLLIVLIGLVAGDVALVRALRHRRDASRRADSGAPDR